MDASGFNQEAVREFIIQNGGKVTNHELVTRFKSALNDPDLRAQNREKFKDYVNTLATIKADEKGGKILVLKKKYKQENVQQEPSPTAAESRHDGNRAMSEPPNRMSSSMDSIDGGGMSKVRSESNINPPEQSSSQTSAMKESSSMGTLSVSSVASSNITQSSRGSSQASVTSSNEEEINASIISVKDRAKHLNRMETESALLRTQPAHRKKEIRPRNTTDGEEDDSHSSGSGYVTLEADERTWLVVCSKGDYHDMHKLLLQNPELAKVRDFTSGYTALHWAAKHGNPDILKLVAPKCPANLNNKTNGGYTPLHIASMHCHEQIIELLVHTYKADSNIRDYSGKKAKQYLPNSASTKAQQLLLSSRLGSTSLVSAKSLDDSFTRSTSFRRSNRAKAISSLIQTTSAGMRKAMLRSSWTGSSENVANDKGHHKGIRSRSPSTTPPGSTDPSPSIQRKEFIYDREKEMMPPPSAPIRKSKKNSSTSSRESLEEEMRGNSVPRSESEPTIRLGNQTYV